MSESADIMIINARALTMDPARPHASVIAVKGRHIMAVGDDELTTLKDGQTQIIDAGGGTVVPGFIDSHVHLFGGSGELDCLNLAHTTGEAALTAAVRAESLRKPDDALLYAVCGNYTMLGPDKTLDRHALDRVMPDRPFAIMAADHHTVWANTKALEMAGILYGGPTGPDGEIVMGADGKATGALLETSAFAHVVRFTELGGRDFLGYITGDDPIPPATPEERERDKAALRLGLQHCARLGVTSVHNMDGNLYQMALLAELEQEGDLLCRVQVPCHLRNTHPLSKLDEALYMRETYTSSMLYSGRVKMFMDGVMDSYTALMVEPYPDRPDTRGVEVFTAEAFNEAVIKADSLGLQISVHCCGDGAVRRTLDAYEAAQKANGRRDSRHRIEHVETVTDADIPRFADLGVIASMQPLHSPAAGLFPPMPKGVIYHDHQVRNAFAWRTLRTAGVSLAFGTDWPIVPLEPMLSVAAALYVGQPDERWLDQQQTLAETLESYTTVAAYTEFAEDQKGQLKPGMLADLAVLSSNLEALDRDGIEQTQAIATLCDGRLTYDGR
ncbi:MAG: amidohydrolase [Alphaproteobacteria bacterium TMED89]|nr:amidohydrolase [Rhodospirillaceae bacterium]RPH19692.1 MAG: amidohydrolase [Alphaproteobacteria bacterium TMED89]